MKRTINQSSPMVRHYPLTKARINFLDIYLGAEFFAEK